MRICKIEGCEGRHKAKGYCKKHYAQLRKHGKIPIRTIRDSNEIIVKGNIAEIVLYDKNCKEVARAIIDAEDVEKVKDFKWYAATRRNGLTAATRTNGTMEYIANIVKDFNPTDKHMLDHEDRNGLNNRKINLRICTHSQNQMNKNKGKNNTSGYKGVSWNKGAKKWQAYINTNGSCFHLGYFKNIKEAALSYNEAAIKYHSNFACLNAT